MNPENIRDQFLKLDVPTKNKLLEMLSEFDINKNSINLKFLIVGILYFYTNYKYFNKRKGYKPLKALIHAILINIIVAAILYMLGFNTQINVIYVIFKYWYVLAALIVAAYYYFIHRFNQNPSRNP